jgi:hypothetical protein
MICFLQLKGIKLPDECTCFHYITAVYLYIHYPDEFKIWNYKMKRYPTKKNNNNPKKKEDRSSTAKHNLKNEETCRNQK